MKGKLDDGTLVDIEKPLPIEQDGKWWEFNEFRMAKDEPVLVQTEKRYNDYIIFHVNSWKENWIASEIPRASPEQLSAIGMRERDGRPRMCKIGDHVWDGLNDRKLCDKGSRCDSVSATKCENEIGKYRFILEPVVNIKNICLDCAAKWGCPVKSKTTFVCGGYAKEKKEAHTSCEGCENESKKISCRNCYAPGLDARRENYKTKQPPRQEELRFSVGEIMPIVHLILHNYEGTHHEDLCRMIEQAFTERRRE